MKRNCDDHAWFKRLLYGKTEIKWLVRQLRKWREYINRFVCAEAKWAVFWTQTQTRNEERQFIKSREERIRSAGARDAQSTSLAHQMGRSAAKSGGPEVEAPLCGAKAPHLYYNTGRKQKQAHQHNGRLYLCSLWSMIAIPIATQIKKKQILCFQT